MEWVGCKSRDAVGDRLLPAAVAQFNVAANLTGSASSLRI